MLDTALDTISTFGQMLKTLRRRVRLTQRDLGIALGYSETHITRLEKGSRAPDVGMVRASFIDALKLGGDPQLARRLIELAEAAHGKHNAKVPDLSRHNNLPAQLTHFIGRTRELAEINQLIVAHRLVTLTGSGGVGKTRLGLEAAAQTRFADGVWWVELAPLADSALVPQTVAGVLKLPNQTERAIIVALSSFLADKHLLLILDNCEHLIQACAELVEILLHACPNLHILATSREALNIPGERAWRVPSLSDKESSQLFVDRAGTIKPDFVLNAQTAALVASIGTQLDGIPLAIELAASRLSGLSVEQLATRLGDRFRLLTSGSRTALPRHQTLRALIDWSHDLLSDQERILLRRLAVFAGGWTAESAEQVCATQVCATSHAFESEVAVLFAPNVLPLLLNLVSKSMVIVDEQDGKVRYRLLETIREYAWEQLAACHEIEITRLQHAHYCLAFVWDGAPDRLRLLGGPVQFVPLTESQTWLKQIDPERNNLRAALTWCLTEQHDVETGMQLALWLIIFWTMRGPRSEGREWLERALAHTHPSNRTQTRAQLLCALTDFEKFMGDGCLAELHAREALAISRELGNRFDIMITLFRLAFSEQLKPIEHHLIQKEWLEIARELGNEHYEGIALCDMGHLAMQQHDLSQAIARYTESVAVLSISDPGTRHIASYFQAAAMWEQRPTDRAMAQIQAALICFRETGFILGVAVVQLWLGRQALAAGDFTQARQCLREGLTIVYQDGARQIAIGFLGPLAALLAANNQPLRATALWAATPAFDPSINASDERERIETALTQLDASTAAAAEAAGHAMSFDQAVAYALAD